VALLPAAGPLSVQPVPAPRTAAHDDLLLREVRALRDEVRALRQVA